MKHDMQPENLIRQEIDAELSFLDSRPSHLTDIMYQIKGERKVKKKLSLGFVLAMLLILITATAAVATTYRGVSWFLTENSPKPAPLNPDYLVSNMEQYHTSRLIHATAVDAYWDGLELSVSYHISPVDPAHVLRMKCDDPSHGHYRPEDEADILLWEPDFINVTSRIDGELTRPLSVSCSWVYEEDGSLSVLVSFPHYDMSGSVWIGIPIFTTYTSTGDLRLSVLNFDPTILADPIQPHVHDWLPATCISQKECAICHRTEEGLGWHDYHPSADGRTVACSVCGKAMNRPVNVPVQNTLHPGEQGVFVLALQLRLNELGFHPGPFTGVYDPLTEEAVRAYQASQGLEADGVCHTDTITKLFP